MPCCRDVLISTFDKIIILLWGILLHCGNILFYFSSCLGTKGFLTNICRLVRQYYEGLWLALIKGWLLSLNILMRKHSFFKSENIQENLITLDLSFASDPNVSFTDNIIWRGGNRVHERTFYSFYWQTAFVSPSSLLVDDCVNTVYDWERRAGRLGDRVCGCLLLHQAALIHFRSVVSTPLALGNSQAIRYCPKYHTSAGEECDT